MVELTCFSLIFHLVYEHIHGADEDENARGDHSHQQGAGDNIVLSLPWWTLFTYIHFRFSSYINTYIHTTHTYFLTNIHFKIFKTVWPIHTYIHTYMKA